MPVDTLSVYSGSVTVSRGFEALDHPPSRPSREDAAEVANRGVLLPGDVRGINRGAATAPAS